MNWIQDDSPPLFSSFSFISAVGEKKTLVQQEFKNFLPTIVHFFPIVKAIVLTKAITFSSTLPLKKVYSYWKSNNYNEIKTKINIFVFWCTNIIFADYTPPFSYNLEDFGQFLANQSLRILDQAFDMKNWIFLSFLNNLFFLLTNHQWNDKEAQRLFLNIFIKKE